MTMEGQAFARHLNEFHAHVGPLGDAITAALARAAVVFFPRAGSEPEDRRLAIMALHAIDPRLDAVTGAYDDLMAGLGKPRRYADLLGGIGVGAEIPASGADVPAVDRDAFEVAAGRLHRAEGWLMGITTGALAYAAHGSNDQVLADIAFGINDVMARCVEVQGLIGAGPGRYRVFLANSEHRRQV